MLLYDLGLHVPVWGWLVHRVTSLNVGIDAIWHVGKELDFAKYIWAIRYDQLTGSSLFLLCF